ncbi:hypothetical protein ANTQUA_LOCUS3466 [Anthophora quadrimaculata]
MISIQRWWNAASGTNLIECTCLLRISLHPRFWNDRIAAIQFLAQLQQETPAVRYFANYTMLRKQRWWNAGSGTLLYESTCQKHISLQQRFRKGRIAAILFSALLQQKTPVVRYFVYYTMLSKQRRWNAVSGTLLYESTCQKHISLQQRFWKGRIAAIQFLALLQQEITVVQYFVNYTMISIQRWWNAGSRTNLIECTCLLRISLHPRFWNGRIAAIQFLAQLQQETQVVRYFVNYTMISMRRWWNACSGTLLHESTCLRRISLPPQFWNGRIAAIQFLAQLQQETQVVRYFVNYTTLSKQRLWNVGTRTNLSESTCQKHISLQQRFWKGRIVAIQFLAPLKQEITVVRYYVNHTMISKQRWWNSGSRTLLYENTCQKHISLQQWFRKGRIAAILFSALLQQITPVVRYIVYYTMLSKQRMWNAVSGTLLYESTCQKHISLPPQFWNGRIAAIQFLALLQQEITVVRYFVNYTMMSIQRWWNAGSGTNLIECTCLLRISLHPRFWNDRIAAIQFLAQLQQETPAVRYFANYTILRKQRWWNAGSGTLLYESTCQKHISLQQRFRKGRIAAILFSALLQQITPVVRYIVYYTMLSKQRRWNAVSGTLLYKSTCQKHISLQQWSWKGRIAAIQFLAQLQQEITVVRYFVNYTMISMQRWWNAGSGTLLHESTCLRRISLPPQFWNGRIAAIQFLALLQQEITVVRYFVNYTMMSIQRWWNAGSRTPLVECTCLMRISLQPRFWNGKISAIRFSALLQQKTPVVRFWNGRIAAIQFLAQLQQETPVVRYFVNYTILSKQRWWKARSRTNLIECTCLLRISLHPRFWNGRIAAIQFLAQLQQETQVVRCFVYYTMISMQRWWNARSGTLLHESTCLRRISLPPQFWNGRIAAIQLLAQLQQETPAVRYFVNYTMLRKQRWWNAGSGTLLYESTCQKHISLQPRFRKGRIAAILFSALLQQKTPVVRYFVYYTMLSKQRRWNAVSGTLLYESTCQKHISLQQRFWKGRIAAIQFLPLLQQEITVVRYFVNYTMMSIQRWWNAGSRTPLVECTCLMRISLQPRFWNGKISAIRFSALLQQKTPVVRYFVNHTMISMQWWWNSGSRTLLYESTCQKHISLQQRFWKGRIAAIQFLALLQQEITVVRYFVNYTMISIQRWWNAGSRTPLVECTCPMRISLPPQFWNGRIAAIQFLALLQQEITVVRYLLNYNMMSIKRWWNAGSGTLLHESTCLRRISLPPQFWNGRIAAIQFLALLQQEITVVRYFVNYTMISMQRWWHAGSGTLLHESTCLMRISLQPRFWNGKISAIRFSALLQQKTPVVRYFVNYTILSKQRWWKARSRTNLIECTCLLRISLHPRFWNGRIAAIQFLAQLQQETQVVRCFVYYTMISMQRWWNARSGTLLHESTCLRRISLPPQFWNGRIAAIQLLAQLQQETPAVRYFVNYTMLRMQRWWNAGSGTLLYESTCQKHISLQQRFRKGRIAAILFSALLQQKTPVVRYFVYYTMLSKQRRWNAVSGPLLYESTCQKHISLQQRFWKGRIAAIQFLALLQQEITVVRYFVNYTMMSIQRWWNAGSRTPLVECTCLMRISLQPRFWNGKISAIRFSALLQQKTPVVRYFVNHTMISMQWWWNSGSRTLLYESTCQKHISLQQRFWKGRTAAIQFIALLQQEITVVRYFVNYTMISIQRWWNAGSRTPLVECTRPMRISLQPLFWKGRIAAIRFSALLQQKTLVVRYFGNYTILSKQRWWKARSRTNLIECTCLLRISLHPRFWNGRIAAIQFLAQQQQETQVVRYFLYYTMISMQRWWNARSGTLLHESTCLRRISLPPQFWNGRIAAILFSALLQQKTPVVRYFVYYTMLSKQRRWNAVSGTLLYESTCQKHISLQQRFRKGRIAAILFSALLQQKTLVVRYFGNYTILSKKRWWKARSRTNLIECTCLLRISLHPRFWNGRIAAIQFLAQQQQETQVVRYFVYYTMLSKQRRWNAVSGALLYESTCQKQISLQQRFWKGRIAAIQFLALLQQDITVVQYFVNYTMISIQRWWNAGSGTLLHECTCLLRISLHPRFWKGIIAAIRFSALLLWKSPVLTYFVYNTMLSNQRRWNSGSRTLLYECTCQKHNSLQQRFWKGRIAAIQFLAQLQQETPVVRYFVNYTTLKLLQQKTPVVLYFVYYTMLSKQRRWNAVSGTLLYESTCQKHISLQQRFWKGRIAAIQFLALLQQEITVVRYFVNYTMLSKQRWWSAGSRTPLVECTCQKHISLQQRFWKGRIAAIQFLALLQQEITVVQYFVNYTMISIQRCGMLGRERL